MAPKPKHSEIASPGKAWMMTGVGKGLPKPVTPQRARAHLIGRWMARGQLLECEGLAVVKRADGWWHFNPAAGAWHGPRGAPVGFATYLTLPATWVALHGDKPALPDTSSLQPK